MKNKLISQSSSGLSIRKLLILSCLTGTIVTTLPLKTIAQPSTTPISQCPAKDWSALQSEINRRYTALETSLDQMIQEVNNPNIPQETIKSVNQIQAIDSLLSCLNNPLVDSQSKQPIIDSLTQLKNNVLLPAQTGLTSNNLIKLKRNIGLQDNEPTIGNNFINRFSGTIETFKENISSEISNLKEQKPASPNPQVPPKDQEKNSTQSPKLELWIAALLITSSIFALVLIFLTYKFQRKISSLENELKQTDSKVNFLENSFSELKLNSQKSYISRTTLSIPSSQPVIPDPDPIFSPMEDTFSQTPYVIPTPLSPTAQLIQTYNTNPGSLQGIGVSETESSFNQRRSGLTAPVVLGQASNPSFYVIQDSYLVPAPKSKITTPKLNTIEMLFDCYEFQSGAEFQLIEPAIVSPLGGNQWQVTQKGKLRFL